LTWALAPALAALAVGFGYPLGRLVVESFRLEGAWTLEHYRDVLSSDVYWHIAWRTIETAAMTTVGCLAVGYPLAYVIARAPRRVAVMLLLVATVPYFTSTLIRSYAWIVILSPHGLIDGLLDAVGAGHPPQLVFNRFGVVVSMIQINLPLMVLTLYSAMARLDRSLVLAAQSLGALPARAFWHVYRPMSMPGVSAGCTLVFISSLGFFVTPALLGGPGEYLIAQAIQVRFSGLVDTGGAAAQATLLLVVAAILLTVFRRQIGFSLPVGVQDAADPPVRTVAVRRALRRLTPARGAVAAGRIGRTLDQLADAGAQASTALRRPVLALLSTAAVLYLTVPMLVVTLWAFSDAQFLSFPPPGYSTRWIQDYFANDQWTASTWFSLWVCAAAAALAVMLGGLAAGPLVRARVRGRTAINIACIAPLILPQIVFALGLLLAMSPLGIAGTPLAFIVGYTILGIPFATVVISAAIRNLDPRFERAAASLGASPFATLRLILVPLLRPAIVTAFVVAFLTGFDDVVLALFVGGPRAVTLPMRLWQEVSQQVSPRIAAVGVVFFLFAAVAATARAVLRRLHRAGAGRRHRRAAVAAPSDSSS
jgi:putative spermidine/putrescine transport system permease protein